MRLPLMLLGLACAALPAADGQRDFARQVHHAANADLYIVSRCIRGEEMPQVQDTAATFGQKLPKWLVWDELNQHTLWTAGQLVANFRKHGMPPPPFSYY